MEMTDVVAVIGLKNKATEMLEAICRSIGMDVLYAMNKAHPDQRIDSIDSESTVSASFEKLPANLFRLGLMAANHLYEEAAIDCNFTEPRDMFGQVLGWFAHRIKSQDDVPNGWVVLDSGKESLEADQDPRLSLYSRGQILADGRLVVDFGHGSRLLQLPNDYRDVFPLIEGYRV